MHIQIQLSDLKEDLRSAATSNAGWQLAHFLKNGSVFHAHVDDTPTDGNPNAKTSVSMIAGDYDVENLGMAPLLDYFKQNGLYVAEAMPEGSNLIKLTTDETVLHARQQQAFTAAPPASGYRVTFTNAHDAVPKAGNAAPAWLNTPKSGKAPGVTAP